MQATGGRVSSTSLRTQLGPPRVLRSTMGHQRKRWDNENEEKTCFYHFEMFKYVYVHCWKDINVLMKYSVEEQYISIQAIVTSWTTWKWTLKLMWRTWLLDNGHSLGLCSILIVISSKGPISSYCMYLKLYVEQEVPRDNMGRGICAAEQRRMN